jgi:hypothetical protein
MALESGGRKPNIIGGGGVGVRGISKLIVDFCYLVLFLFSFSFFSFFISLFFISR